MCVKHQRRRQDIPMAVALVGTLALVLIGWFDSSSAESTEKLDRQESSAARAVKPSGATLVEAYTLVHQVAGAGDFRIEVENFDDGNVMGGFSALRIFDQVGNLHYFEFSQPPLAKEVRPITLRAGNAELLFMMHRLDYDGKNPLLLRVYDIYAPGQSRTELRLWS